MGPEDTALWHQRWMSLLVAVQDGCRVEPVLVKCIGSQIEKMYSHLTICERKGVNTIVSRKGPSQLQIQHQQQ